MSENLFHLLLRNTCKTSWKPQGSAVEDLRNCCGVVISQLWWSSQSGVNLGMDQHLDNKPQKWSCLGFEKHEFFGG